MTGGDSKDPTADWADDVVEGAAAFKAVGSEAGRKIHEIDEGDQGARLSSAVPDEGDISPEPPKRERKKKIAPDNKAPDSTRSASDSIGSASDEIDVVEVVDGETDMGKASDTVDASDADAQLATEVSDVSVEGLIADLERVTEEKNQYLDTSRRLQADFENYRKRVAKDTSDARARGKEAVISEVLNVLDACDGAVANGAADIEPIRGALLSALGNQGMERIDPVDEAFDPEMHQAVMHDEASDGKGPTVVEVMRAGYKLGGRVIRPAMVRVRG